MTPRWHWDFEDVRPPRRPTPPAPPAPPTPPAPAAPPAERVRVARFRRRRALAFAALVALIALLVSLLSGSGRQHATQPASAAIAKARARAHPPSDRENDQDGAVSSVLAYTPFVRSGGGKARGAALTFDDGPGPFTPQVLSVLEHFHVHATFFAIGRMERY